MKQIKTTKFCKNCNKEVKFGKKTKGKKYLFCLECGDDLTKKGVE